MDVKLDCKTVCKELPVANTTNYKLFNSGIAAVSCNNFGSGISSNVEELFNGVTVIYSYSSTIRRVLSNQRGGSLLEKSFLDTGSSKPLSRERNDFESVSDKKAVILTASGDTIRNAFWGFMRLPGLSIAREGVFCPSLPCKRLLDTASFTEVHLYGGESSGNVKTYAGVTVELICSEDLPPTFPEHVFSHTTFSTTSGKRIFSAYAAGDSDTEEPSDEDSEVEDDIRCEPARHTQARTNIIKNKVPQRIWHERIGHSNKFPILAKQRRNCLCCKHADAIRLVKKSKRDKRNQQTTPLWSTSWDHHGPINDAQIGYQNELYIFVGVCTASKYRWCLPARNKNECVNQLKNVIRSETARFAQRRGEIVFRLVRTDNAPEFSGGRHSRTVGQYHEVGAFRNMLKAEHSEWSPSIPYSPSTNGEAEHVVKDTVSGCRKCLVCCDTRLWPQAAVNFTLIHNHSPSIKLENFSPLQYIQRYYLPYDDRNIIHKYSHPSEVPELRNLKIFGTLMTLPPRLNKRYSHFYKSFFPPVYCIMLTAYGQSVSTLQPVETVHTT